MLDYVSLKEQSVERASARIPDYFENNVQTYFIAHNNFESQLIELEQWMGAPDITNLEYDLISRKYQSVCDNYLKFKYKVINKLDKFSEKADELIETYHPEEAEKYRDEFDEGMDVVKSMVDGWAAELDKRKAISPVMIK